MSKVFKNQAYMAILNKNLFHKISRRNVLPNATNSYLSTCLNNPNTDPYCPVFQIKDILNSVEPDQNEQTQIFLKVTKMIKKI